MEIQAQDTNSSPGVPTLDLVYIKKDLHRHYLDTGGTLNSCTCRCALNKTVSTSLKEINFENVFDQKSSQRKELAVSWRHTNEVFKLLILRSALTNSYTKTKEVEAISKKKL